MAAAPRRYEASEQGADAFGVQLGAVLGGEHPPAVDPAVAQRLLLGQLSGGLLPQHCHRLGIQCDQPASALGLGLGLTELAVDRHQGTHDRHAAVLDVEVTPGQPQGLASPAAGHRQEAPQGVEALLGHTVQEGMELLLRPDRKLRVLGRGPWRVGAGGGVGLQVAPLHGVTQGPMQDGMDVVHGIGGEAA